MTESRQSGYPGEQWKYKSVRVRLQAKAVRSRATSIVEGKVRLRDRCGKKDEKDKPPDFFAERE